MRNLTIEQSNIIPDWYVVRGGSTWAAIEGSSDDWRAIVKAMRERQGCRCERAAFEPLLRENGIVERILYSPRNACSYTDFMRLSDPEIDGLAASIESVLPKEKPMHPNTVKLLSYFSYTHLPEKLQEVSRPIAVLAEHLAATLPECPETTVGLRKLLEAKDCFVRAALDAKPVEPAWCLECNHPQWAHTNIEGQWVCTCGMICNKP